MVRRILCLLVVAAFLAHTPATAQTNFKQGNPDVGKYAFARSYINALSYINKIQVRLKKANPKKLYRGDDIKIMRGYVANIIKDDMNLRIARNLLEKYLESPNALIRKTTDTFISACQTHMAINAKEKEIWDQWFAVKSNKLDSRKNETAFLNAQQELSLKRKDANKKIIEATVMVTKVLRSSSRNKDERGRALDLTTKQRDELLSLLDAYGKDTLAWGLKPGQDHMQASIAVLREVLEDSTYTTLDE